MAWRVIPDLNYPMHDNRWICATCGESVYWDGMFEARWNSADGTAHLHATISVDSAQWDGISPGDEEGWQTVTSLRDLSLYPNISLNQSESNTKKNVKQEL